MAVVLSLNTHKPFPVLLPLSSLNYRSGPIRKRNSIYFAPIRIPGHRHPFLNNLSNKEDSNPENAQEEVADHEVNDLGVKAALSMLKFYKREISPLLPRSCRYVPTCSEYSMEAYKKYGVVKGTVLTAWRLCRCNPLGGSGFDPPRWFDERSLPEE